MPKQISALPVKLVAFSALLICSCRAAKQLVSYDASGKYHLHESALREIEELPSPVLVLAAVGDARVGKSTFLNMVDLHWDPSAKRDTLQFKVDDTGRPCTRGLWIHTRRLPEGGSLVLVDVEGDNLGNDAVAEQLSALTALISSHILLFVREVVSNSALEFLYHTTELGKMFPDSNNFPHLGVAVRDALKLDPIFRDRQSEVAYAITSPTHKDENDEMRKVIAAVFPPHKISAFEVAYQEREQLKNLQDLTTGPYFDSVQKIVSQLKKTISQKLTPVSGMAMCGGDLVQMIRKLFTALDNGDIKTLETAYVRLEKQMCDSYYSEWITPVMSMSEDEFMHIEQHNLKEFAKQCKIDSYVEHVTQEIGSKKNGIIQERQERERRKKAEEEQRRAKERQRIAEEQQKRAEEEKRMAKEKQRIAEEKQRAEEKERRRTEEMLRQKQEELKREEERSKKAIAEKNEEIEREKRKRRSGGGGGFSIELGPIKFSLF